MIGKDETGAALPLTLIVISVLTLLGFTLLMFSITETVQVYRDENKLQAHYIARSGAHAVASYLIENPEEALNLIDSPQSEETEFAGGRFEVLVYGDPNNEIYVKSTGKVDGVEQTVIATVKNVGVNFVLYGNQITVNGSAAKISGGDVVHGGIINIVESIVQDGEIIELKRNYDQVLLPCSDPESVFYGFCPAEHLGNLTSGTVITGDSLYGNIRLNSGELEINPGYGQNLLLKASEISLGGNAQMTVKLDNNTVALVVDDFKNTGNSKVYVEGNGFLLFYVNNYKGGGTFHLEPGSEALVNVFVTTGGAFDLSGTPNFKGAVYAPHAFVDLFGTSTVTGWVISDSLYGGGTLKMYFSPIEMAKTSFELQIFRLEKWRYAS